MALAGVTVPLRELYETDDQNYVLFIAEVTQKVVDVKGEMLRR